MKQFTGFPAKMQFTPLPNLLFSRLLPQINDMAELKTTLHILETLYRKRGYPRFVTYKELLANKSLMSSLNQITKPADEVLHNSLEMATKRGTVIHLKLDKDGKGEDIYFLNTESDKQVIAKIQSGELQLPGLKAERQAYIETEELPDIYTLYEQNIVLLPRLTEHCEIPLLCAVFPQYHQYLVNPLPVSRLRQATEMHYLTSEANPLAFPRSSK